MTRDEIITIIKPILEQHSVERASFFGSYARGTYIVGQLKNALALARIFAARQGNDDAACQGHARRS